MGAEATMRILLTGSRTGIGRHLARHLLQSGHEVWGVARRKQADFAQECAAQGLLFRSAEGDVADWTRMAALGKQVEQAWKHLDGLICAAGAQLPLGPAVSVDPPAWMAGIQLNLGGTFFTLRALHGLLRRAARRGKVICFSGGGATGPRPNFSAYACAKAGVVRLVETLAAEWAGQPMDINAVAPGAIRTGMTEEVLKLGPAVVGEKEYAQARTQMAGGGASLEKVAGLVDFLLSPESDGISGRLISAPWDPWPALPERRAELAESDIYTLRRIGPEDRGKKWQT